MPRLASLSPMVTLLISFYRQFMGSTPFLDGQSCPDTSYPTTATVPSFFSKSSNFAQVTALHRALSHHCGCQSSAGLMGQGFKATLGREDQATQTGLGILELRSAVTGLWDFAAELYLKVTFP